MTLLKSGTHKPGSVAMHIIFNFFIILIILLIRTPIVSFGEAITSLGIKSAPIMADFSSRGPQPLYFNSGVSKVCIDHLSKSFSLKNLNFSRKRL
jgi:hypothetical protein